jgi:methyltransferase-like protein/SAM-dependent methyltransferase
MSALPVNPYDVVPYPDLSYGNTHPDRLATMARLLGLTPAPVERCRVLEIGCAAGGNLLPMAYGLPAAEFVGIDYSSHQIEAGQAQIAALGLSNLTLHCRDLREVGDELGDFDYFIAHGVYSWTPAPVRDRLLALCKQVLRPQGVAYISYNTYPGWRITGIIRDAMLYHGRNATTPGEKSAAARAMLEAMAEHATEPAYAGIFRSYAAFLGDGLKGSSDAFLLHDELEEVNEPVYFHQFVAHAQQHGLAYLVEAELHDVLPSVFRPEAQAALQRLADDAIALEQYMDFLRNRMFRQTLLCHQEIPARRTLRPEPVMGAWLRSTAVRVAPSDERPNVAVFKSKGDATLATDHPLTIAAMEILIESAPHALTFADLLAAAQRALPDVPRPAGPAPEEIVLAANLLRAHGQSMDLVEIHSYAPALPVRLGERPEASAVARRQSATREMVTNLWHQRVTLQPRQRELLALLDGSRRREELPGLMTGEVRPEEIDAHLRWFQRTALMVA